MKILTEDELVDRLDYRRPLHPEPEEPPGRWCIPFEYGANEKGTRISISLARTIIAQLTAEVALAELFEVKRELAKERDRSKELGRQATENGNKWMDALGRTIEAEKKLRTMKRTHAKRKAPR